MLHSTLEYLSSRGQAFFLTRKSFFFVKREGISLKFASDYIPNYIKHLERKSTSKQDPRGAIYKYPFLPGSSPVFMLTAAPPKHPATQHLRAASEALKAQRQLPLQDR
jgi:hypothetical protein